MLWIREEGGLAPQEAVDMAKAAAREFGVPLGILLGSCECETDFRLGLVSSAGAVGPLQFLPGYAADYYRYAGFVFDLEGWDALRGAAAVFLTYATWGRERHGLQGEDAWRFAVSAHRYGQNSQTCLDRENRRVLDVEAHMRRNGLWYGVQEDGGGQAEADGGEQTEAAQTAAQAAAWTLDKLGCRYSQADRLEADAFDCSSLVARAYAAQGVVWGCQGAPVPSSNREVYDDHFRLLWPESYDKIGQSLGGKEVLDLAKQPGDLQFLCTDSSTGRSNRITHVAMVANDESIVHARGKAYGVRLDGRGLYAGKVCALTRYDPEAPLRRGMQGGRVKALQHALNARGAALEEDGIYGEKTAQAYTKHLGTAGPETPETPVAQVEITGERVNLRAGPGTEYPVLDTLRAGELLALVDTEGWRTVLRDGVLAYVSKAYSREVRPT